MKDEVRVRARKRYWWVYSPVWVIIGLVTFGIGLLLIPLCWWVDKSMATAAYTREARDLPPAWYDGISKWEFKLVNK